MTMLKVAVTIPAQVLKRARHQVRVGRAKSLSAFVSEALAEKVERTDLKEILDAMDQEFGKPKREDRAWAKRVLQRSS